MENTVSNFIYAYRYTGLYTNGHKIIRVRS